MTIVVSSGGNRRKSNFLFCSLDNHGKVLLRLRIEIIRLKILLWLIGIRKTPSNPALASSLSIAPSNFGFFSGDGDFPSQILFRKSSLASANHVCIAQATLPGFVSRGLSLEEAELLLEKSVKLAVDARDKFWDAMKRVPGHSYNRALVAASIGSYGAYLADGSEYSGCYGPDVTRDKLKDFHRRRLQVLVDAGPDMLAFETIPNKLEAQACIELLEEEDVQIPSWICFSSVDGENAPSGESFKECLDIINKSSKVNVVGINCAPPHFIESLIRKFKELTDKAVIVYPNSGEVWDGRAKRWLPSKCFDDDKFELFATRWRDSGAKLIGGCCRTTPSTIKAISKVLKERF